MKKRILSTFLSLVLCLSLIPTAAVAEETCTHENYDDETGVCSTSGCGYQYPVLTENDWHKSIDDVPFDNGVMDVVLYGDTGSGSTISPEGYGDDMYLQINLAGHTLESNISATTASTLPLDIYIVSQNDHGSTVAGTFDGSITVDLANTGLDIADGVTVTGKVTINGTTSFGRSVWLNKGATLAGGIKLNVPGRTLEDCLPTNTAYADATTGVLVDGNVTEITEAVKVVEHKSHTYDAATGKCGCGAECPHSSINADAGQCAGCGYQFPVKVVSYETTSWYTAFEPNRWSGDNLEVTLFGDAKGSLRSSENISFLTIDLNGHTLDGSLNFVATYTPMSGTLTNSSKTNGGTITGAVTVSGVTYANTLTISGDVTVKGKVTVQSNGVLTLGAGVTLAGGIDASLASKNVADCLASNTVLAKKDADGSYTVLVAGKQMQIDSTAADPLKVVAHTSHTFTDGKCGCGYSCPHAQGFDTTTGKCVTCGKQKAVKLSNSAGSVSWYQSVSEAYSMTQTDDSSPFQITLFGDVTETGISFDQNKTFELDLNGHTLAFTAPGNNDNIIVSSGTLNIRNSDSSKQSEIVGGVMVENDGWATLGAGLTITVQLRLNAATVFDVLADGAAYVDGEGNVIQKTDSPLSLLAPAKTIAHTHAYGADGKCACGVQRVATVEIDGKTTDLTSLSSLNNLIAGKTAMVTLLADATGVISVSSGTIVLDLNGKTLTGPLTVSGGNVTVNANGGKITGNVSLTNGYLTLNGGTYYGTVTASGGTLYITSGTFNGTVDLGSGSASLSGGSFNALKAGKNLMDYLAENRAFATAENGSVGESVTKNLKNVKVIEHYSTDHIDKDAPFSQCDFCGKDLAAYITKADNSKEYFESLASALENVQDGQTVTLLSLTALTSDTTISGKSFTFDLSNKEICGSVQYGTGTLTIASGAGLTLKGTTGGELIVPVKVDGTLTVDSAVTLDNVSVESGGHITVNADAKFSSLSITGGTATLKSGTFTTLSVGTEDKLKDKITLGTDKALRGSDKWYTGDSLKVNRLSNVSVQAIPVRDLTIVGPKSGTYNMEATLSPTYTDADGKTVTVNALPEGVTIYWYRILGEYEAGIAGGSVFNLAYKYNPGTETFRCKVTVDGYTASADITITITRADLPADTKVTLTHEGETLRVGDTLTAKVENLPDDETLSTTETTYTYYVGGVEVEGVTGSTLTVPSGSAGKTITVTAHIVTEGYAGDVTSDPTAAVQKKEGPATATAPEDKDLTITHDTISIANAVTGQEYAVSTTNTAPTSGWVTPANGSVTFEELAANTTYYIFYRVAETEEAEAGDAQSVSKTTDKAAAVITIAEPGSIVYDDEKVTAGTSDADLTYTYTGDGDVTVKWYNDSNGSKGSERSGAPKNAGTYWVGISAAEGTNYAAVAEVTRRFTISPRPLPNDIRIVSTLTYNGTKQQVGFSVYESNGYAVPGSEYRVVDDSEFATDVGSNTLTIKGVGNYTGTVTKEWSLQKRTPEAADFTAAGLSATEYNGTAKAVTAALKSTMTGAGALTVYYAGSGDTTYAKSTTAPTDAGTYAVTLDVAEGTNFNAASGLSLGTLTIKPASQSVSVQGGNIVRGSTLDLSELVTVTGVSGGSATGELSYSPVVTLPDGVTLNGSTLAVSQTTALEAKINIFIIAAATQNYKEGKTQITLTVKDKYDAVVTISNAPDSTAYGDSFTVTASVGTGVTGGTWSWKSSNSNILAITGGADSATVTVEAKKADTTGAKLTVTYTSNTHYGTKETSGIPVTKKALTITGVTAIDRDYNGYTTVELTGGELVGKVEGDVVSFFLGAGTAESANAGTQKVTTRISLNGSAVDNYTLTQPDDITVTIRKIDPSYTVPTGLTAIYGQTLADVDLTGHTGWSWADATRSVGDASDTARNFKAVFTPTDTTNYNVMSNIDVPVKVGKADPAVPTGLAGLKGNALSTVTLPEGWTWDNDTTIMDETKEYPASRAGSANYNAKSAVGVTVTVSDKQPQVLAVTMDGWTYGEAANDPQYTMPEGAAKLTTQYKVKGAADSTYASDVPTGAGEYTVRVSYETATELWSGSADFTIAKVTPTGEPKYTAITASGKKLSDANLTTVDGTFSVAGSVKWVDAEGNDLADTTEVAANTAYKWLFTPTDSGNYNILTSSITLWHRSSGGSSGGSSTSTTTKNPDGSTTTTTTDKKTGEVTETTKNANGVTGTTVTDKDGNVTDISANIPASATKDGETVALPINEVKPENGTTIDVNVPAGGATIEVPVKDPTPGTVIVIVDKDGTETVIPGSKVTENGIEVKLTEDATIKVIDNSKSFDDVKPGDYFSKPVQWASARNITGGTSATTFGPHDSCTRAQLVTFLYRYAQSQNSGFTGAWMFQLPFSDVPEWCYESVAWCYMNNIVGGYGNGLFGSNDTITREQMAVILYRFAQKTGLDTTQGGMAVREYSDYESISDYAVTAMQWAVNAGILQGYNNHLMPGQPCTRAQIVTMLYRLLGT